MAIDPMPLRHTARELRLCLAADAHGGGLGQKTGRWSGIRL